mmetsp:Transcript_21359/g.59390  ORF Transcript_21359/g.59390 Transcript_21359/m.59390 type:complete len:220 (-) Transcript_21359:590-1249(-)
MSKLNETRGWSILCKVYSSCFAVFIVLHHIGALPPHICDNGFLWNDHTALGRRLDTDMFVCVQLGATWEAAVVSFGLLRFLRGKILHQCLLLWTDVAEEIHRRRCVHNHAASFQPMAHRPLIDAIAVHEPLQLGCDIDGHAILNRHQCGHIPISIQPWECLARQLGIHQHGRSTSAAHKDRTPSCIARRQFFQIQIQRCGTQRFGIDQMQHNSSGWFPL